MRWPLSIRLFSLSFAFVPACPCLSSAQAKILNLLSLKQSVGALVVVRLEDVWANHHDSMDWLKNSVLADIDLPWKTDMSESDVEEIVSRDARGWYKGQRSFFSENMAKRLRCSIYLSTDQRLKFRINRDMVRSVNSQLDPLVEHLLGYQIIKVRWFATSGCLMSRS